MTRSPRRLFALGLTSLVFGASCAVKDKHSNANSPTPDGTRSVSPVPIGDVPDDPAATSEPPGPIAFEATAPVAYIAKVKNLLTGLAPTDQEISAIMNDPPALKSSIDTWMRTPQFRDKTLAFFRDAFQQSQVSLGNVYEATGNVQLQINNAYISILEHSIMESFPRTAWQIVSEGRPFTETVTTTRYMLTPPLMTFMAWLDAQEINDRNQRVDLVQRQWPDFHYILDHSKENVRIEQSLDPSNPYYMRFYDPAPRSCGIQRRVFSTANRNLRPEGLASHMFGRWNGPCKGDQAMNYDPIFAQNEWDDWRLVNIRQPQPGEVITPYFDLIAMRKANELVTKNPHVGFFGTLAFWSNWATNTSNQSRVTMNQTLIVALGRSFDGSLNATPVSENGLSMEHAAPNTECYGCHQTLDPMRQVFRQAYSLYYHEQSDPMMLNKPGVFAFDGVSTEITGIPDLAQTIANHPRFATAWTQKLCYYANSAPCAEDDPEFQRVAAAFQSSGFNYLTLVRELFSSPLVTGASATETTMQNGTTVSIARRNHFCVTLGNRLGLDDICGLKTINPNNNQRTVMQLAITIPIDGYVRGSEQPVVYTTPNLFHRVAAEKVCRAISNLVVDVPANQGPSHYSSRSVPAAISDMVHNLMGLPSIDPRAAEAERILTEHNAAVIAGGGAAIDALKSTFTLACLSPTSVILGL